MIFMSVPFPPNFQGGYNFYLMVTMHTVHVVVVGRVGDGVGSCFSSILRGEILTYSDITNYPITFITLGMVLSTFSQVTG